MYAQTVMTITECIGVTKTLFLGTSEGDFSRDACCGPFKCGAAMVVMPIPLGAGSTGTLVQVPSSGGQVPAVVYSGGANPACIYLFLPGIRGNLDVPGVGDASCDLDLDRWASPSGRGSMFARLAAELASGEDMKVAPWAPRDRRSATHAKTTTSSAGRPRVFRATCALMSWRASEDETAAAIASEITEEDDVDSVGARRLSLAVEDACAVATYLRRTSQQSHNIGKTPPRVAFVGFGFGAAVGWAAASKFGADAVAAVVSVSGAHVKTNAAQALKIDTPGCITRLALIPKLWIHGVADTSTSPTTSRTGFEVAKEPKCVAFIMGGEHRLDIAREAAYEPMKVFLVSTLTSEYLSSVGCDAPFGVELGDTRRAATPCTGARVMAMPAAIRGDSKFATGKKKNWCFQRAAHTYDTQLMFEVLKGGNVPALGAGWVDVSRALGEGNTEAARLLMDAAIDAGRGTLGA